MLRFGYQVETCRFGKRAPGLNFVPAAVAAGYCGAAEPASTSPERELTLAECIVPAVRNNRGLGKVIGQAARALEESLDLPNAGRPHAIPGENEPGPRA